MESFRFFSNTGSDSRTNTTTITSDLGGSVVRSFDTNTGRRNVGLEGTTFSFKRTGGAPRNGFFVRSVEVSAIPLPPAALGLVAAFALAVGISRKQRSA